MKSIIVDNEFGTFIAKKEGVCINISIPAKTSTDWKRAFNFIDLPYMNEETFNNFIDFILKASNIFKEDKKETNNPK